MKKYTDKELAAMSQEELKALQEKALEENKLLGQQIEKILANSSHPTAVDGINLLILPHLLINKAKEKARMGVLRPTRFLCCHAP